MFSFLYSFFFISFLPFPCLPTALGALCGQLTFRLAWCREHSAVTATELLQPLDLACGTLFRSSCAIQTSPDDSWRDIFFGKHERGALWLLICSDLEKHLLTYSLTYFPFFAFPLFFSSPLSAPINPAATGLESAVSSSCGGSVHSSSHKCIFGVRVGPGNASGGYKCCSISAEQNLKTGATYAFFWIFCDDIFWNFIFDSVLTPECSVLVVTALTVFAADACSRGRRVRARWRKAVGIKMYASLVHGAG